MKKTYIKPEVEVIILKDNLMEELPIDSQEHDDDVLAKPDIVDDSEDEGWDEGFNIWE